MQRGAISPVVAVILLIAIAISATAIFFTWQSRLVTQTQESGSESASQLTSAAGGTLQVVNINGTGLKVKNIGSSSLTNITVYLDDNEECILASDAVLQPKQSIANWSCFSSTLTGSHVVKVIADEGAQTVVPYSG